MEYPLGSPAGKVPVISRVPLLLDIMGKVLKGEGLFHIPKGDNQGNDYRIGKGLTRDKRLHPGERPSPLRGGDSRWFFHPFCETPRSKNPREGSLRETLQDRTGFDIFLLWAMGWTLAPVAHSRRRPCQGGERPLFYSLNQISFPARCLVLREACGSLPLQTERVFLGNITMVCKRERKDI